MPEGPYWLDAQLVPWLTQTFGVPAYSASYLGNRDASDDEVFQAAREARAVVVSKDSDFLDRVTQLGPPPQLLYVTCGNTSTRFLKDVFTRVFPEAHRLLGQGEPVVEIGDREG